MDIQKQVVDEEIESPYCPVCGGCGYVACDGVAGFLLKHVKGKTNCMHEEQFIDEIIQEHEFIKEDTDNLIPPK